LATRTVLFAGISADDVAAGGHLERLTKIQKLDVGTHYWVTDRIDAATNKWAESVGIRIIRYHNSDGKHTELDEFFADLSRRIPEEKEASPVSPVMTTSAAACLPDPASLAKEDAETIRTVLNTEARRILQSGDQNKYKEYEAFCDRYHQAIYHAWYVRTKPPENVLLGYKLSEEIASGGFGTVYRAQDQHGNVLAVKLLHEKIRDQPATFQGFRRGVASMEILSRRHVPGVVAYRQAFEIPAFVVMDYVDGPTLQQAVEVNYVKDWATLLKIAVDLARVIRSSHQLPERVLHRDIRPSNVMLRGRWGDENEWELVVLDFDLSWHRDAKEVSVTVPGASNAYLAPEQVYRSKSGSTRNAAVDSYGLGMTLFFLGTRKHPEFMQHRRKDWSDVLRQSARAFSCPEWSSHPNRFFRLVYCATLHEQAERWDVSQILGELERLLGTVKEPTRIVSAEVLAEELAHRSFLQGYEWDPDTLSAKLELPTGLTATLRANEVERSIDARIEWMRTNVAHYSRVTKWLPKASEKAGSLLRKADWRLKGGTNVGYTVGVEASIGLDQLRSRVAESSETIAEVIETLSFD
jgi:serine/threonine protein kinase